MPKLAEKEARGTTETVEDCCVRLRLACSAYASVAAVLGEVCVAISSPVNQCQFIVQG